MKRRPTNLAWPINGPYPPGRREEGRASETRVWEAVALCSWVFFISWDSPFGNVAKPLNLTLSQMGPCSEPDRTP